MSCDNCHKVSDFDSDNIYTWCTNCGNYGIYAAVKRALVGQEIDPQHTMLCFDIGCHGNGSDKIGGYRFHGLHGRVLPLAAGISATNPNVTVIAHAGDGGTLSEGVNHFVHAIRNNYNITFILHNNSNYGLTTGQASSTTPQGTKMNSTPDGVYVPPMHILEFAFSLNPTFIARGFSGNVNQLTEIIQAGIRHPGFSLIEVLQDCPTYNKATPHSWYLERVYDVKEIENYDVTDMHKAREVARDLENRIVTGLLYIDQDRPSFNQAAQVPNLMEVSAPGSLNSLIDSFK